MNVHDLRGQVIGQYTLREPLGQGGMGVVYRAWQSNLEREVAFKVLPLETDSDTELTKRFIREARIVAKLEHPHIVAVHDYGTHDFGDNQQVSYIAMRLLTGGSLADQIKQGKRFSSSEAVTLASQLAGALDYAHSKGIIHRDIKSSNIMFDERGTVFLVDFGIAKPQDDLAEITSMGQIVGTPDYMAAEQWGSEAVTAAVDQYALAVVLYELLSGRKPFEAPDIRRLLHKLLYDEPTSLLEYRVDVPLPLWDVLQRALAKDPSARYASAQEFAQELQQALTGEATDKSLSTTETSRVKTKELRATPQRRLVVPITFSLIILLLVVAGGIAAFTSTSQPRSTPTIALSSTPHMRFTNSIQGVCLITEGGVPVDDGTFNQYAYEGMQRAAEDFNLVSSYVESQFATSYDDNINTCIERGSNVIIGVGFTLADAMLAAAEANPDLLFMGVDHNVINGPVNYVGIQFREDQAGFLAGTMAALMTQTNTIGGVYGMEIPPVIRFRVGFEQGAHYINPDINVLGIYSNNFDCPLCGATHARVLISDSADVIFGAGGYTGSGAIALAAGEGMYVIGVDQDEYFTTFEGGEVPGADRLLTSAIKRIDSAIYRLIEIIVNRDDANWAGGNNYILDISNYGIGFSPAHDAPVPQAVTDRMNQVLEGLRDGSITTGVEPSTGELIEPSSD